MLISLQIEVWGIFGASDGRLVSLFELEATAREECERLQALEADYELRVVGPITVRRGKAVEV